MTTRKGIFELVARELGGYTGTVLSGSTTTAVLGGLVGTSGDSYLLQDASLYFPDADPEDQERIVTAWDDTEGEATFATRTVADPTDEAFMVFPKNTYNATTIRNAINDCLEKTRRSWRTETILVPDLRQYHLKIGWLRSRKDVDAVQYRSSPNLLINEDFSRWYALPDGWAGDGVATENFSLGDYALKLERAGTDLECHQTLSLPLVRWLAREVTSLSFAALVWADTAAMARVTVTDGINTTSTVFHTGDETQQWLTGTHNLAQNATQVKVTCEAIDNNGESVFSRAILHTGTPLNETLQDRGSSAYMEQEITANLRNISSTPVMELADSRSGQVLTYTRRGYAVPATDTATIPMPEAALFHGTMYNLVSMHRRGEDRTRLDRLAVMHGNAYTQLIGDLIDLPTPMPLGRYLVSGA